MKLFLIFLSASIFSMSNAQSIQTNIDYFVNDTITFRQVRIDGHLISDYFIKTNDTTFSDFSPIYQKRVYYPETGNLKILGNFNTDSQKDGFWQSYYPSGILRSVVEYKSDFIIGSVKNYYESGNIKSIGECDTLVVKGYTLNFYTGNWTEYFENGQIKQQGSYSPYEYKIEMDFQSILLEIALHSENGAIDSEPIKIRTGQWLLYSEKKEVIDDSMFKNGIEIE